MNATERWCVLQFNYISDDNHDTYYSRLEKLLRQARPLVNPWRIVRDDGVVIASSYDGFTSKEQAERNGRVD